MGKPVRGKGAGGYNPKGSGKQWSGGWNSKDTGGKGGGGKGQAGSTAKGASNSKGGKWYSGSGKGGQSGGGAWDSSSGGGSDSQRFLQKLEHTKQEQLAVQLAGAQAMWQRCWVDAARGGPVCSADDLERLATVLARIPLSADASLDPPPLPAVEAALTELVRQAPAGEEALRVVNVVLPVVERLLAFEWEAPKLDVRGSLERVLQSAAAKLALNLANPDFMSAMHRVSSLLQELQKDWVIKRKAQHGGGVIEPSTTFLDSEQGDGDAMPRLHHSRWRSATVEWLCCAELFVPSELPKMQTPDSKSHGVYESRQHYFDTQLRLMVGMAFSDGHAHVSPRCWEKECGGGLWPLPPGRRASGSALWCRVRDCQGAPALACSRHGNAVCARHADAERVKVLGQAGPGASTHIYDGRVRYADITGKLYLDHVASRRPPTERGIHWKSTKRLQAPSLVAVVRLEMQRGRGLRKTDALMWGEIVPHAQGKDEYQWREQGRLCINLTSIVDPDTDQVPGQSAGRSGAPRGLAALDVEAAFAEGDYVAVIDCMTFVPEYIPVLKALEQQEQEVLPFEDGALLNLCAQRPADTSNTVNAEGLFDSLGSGSAVLPKHTIAMLVEEMIDRSTLQPIREIRQNMEITALLKADMVALVQEATLDQGQLVNFIDSLRNPVHLTQGPPGTGKSYLGVVIVRALIKVRDYWMQLNPAAGSRPILVLSYKNHATDEFLADLLKAEPRRLSSGIARGSNRWNSSWSAAPRAELVRMGKSDAPELQPFLEGTLSQRGDHALKNAQDTLRVLQRLRKACLTGCKAALLFQSYQAEVFGAGAAQETPEQRQAKRNNALYEATEVLFASMVRANRLATKFRTPKNRVAGDTGDDGGFNWDDCSFNWDDCGINFDDCGFNWDRAVAQKLSDVAQFMLLDKEDDQRCRELQATATGKEMRRELALLYDGIQHYIEINPMSADAHEVLYMFLKGERPLPLCEWKPAGVAGTEQHCGTLAMEREVRLCNAHRCHLPVDGKRCVRPTHPSKEYLCEAHMCWTAACEEPRIAPHAEEHYCRRHACFQCVRLQCRPAQEAWDDPPRHACWDHRLCCASACSELALADQDYCQAHSQHRCQWTTRRGARCDQPAISRDMPCCAAHADAYYDAQEAQRKSERGATRPESDDDTVDPSLAAAVRRNNAKRVCKGTTKKSRPCKSWAMPDSDYCQQHAPPDESHRLHREKLELAAVAAPRADTPHRPSGVSFYEAEGFATPRSYRSEAEEAGLGERGGSAAAAPGWTREGEPEQKDDAPGDPREDDDDDDDDDAPFGPPLGLDAADTGRYDNIDEVDEPEAQQHMRDIFDLEEGDADAEDAGDDAAADAAAAPGAGAVDPGGFAATWAAAGARHAFETSATQEEDDLVETKTLPQCPQQWDWGLSVEDRWEACQAFMNAHIDELQAVLDMVRRQLPLSRKRVQEATVKAKAKVYENKTVIGGTIVGCIARLQSIRATRPFAVVVEEASEVLEPLLFACLGSTVQKFQMIGDHLQLQPNLMDKFDFTRVNKINISMFERLIRAPHQHAVPNGVLAVQRRMRQDVCDLTREYYKDIVPIEDHDVCATKTLPGDDARRSFWGGREVPGVQSHIFLWTHSGEQSKAEVGLSKINRHEANLTVWLAYYLVSCGVERKSIAILTPYKGQLMLMRKLLLQDRTKNRLLAWDNTEPNQVRLSTVDRFQGDEADVVLISLVVDENSRTPFVKLVNRMIVLLSRARLGMYVLGNVGYFENRRGGSTEQIRHWMRTFEILNEPPARSDNCDAATVSASRAALPASHAGRADAGAGSGAGSETVPLPLREARFAQKRVGSRLPLCCPQHPLLSCLDVDKAEDLKLGFCEVLCEQVLSCSHACGLQCHWPRKQHNKSCEVQVPSPCDLHPESLSCKKVFDNAPRATKGADPIDVALMCFECPVKVDFQLECGHEERMACHVGRAIDEGRRAEPPCVRPSPHPFIYPDCRHTKEVTCKQFAEYTDDPESAGRCAQLVAYMPRDCAHERKVKCFQELGFRSGTLAYVCPEKLDVSLPRCGHKARVSCKEDVELRRWALRPDEEPCTELGVVREGGRYGERDHVCRDRARFVRKCGHEQEMSCEEAFLTAANGPRPCAEAVPATHPHCGHACTVRCEFAPQLAAVPKLATAPEDEVHEGSSPPFPANLPGGVARCAELVMVRRLCGHTSRVACAQSRAGLPKCTEAVKVVSPLCGHEIDVPCHLTQQLERWRPWEDTAFASLLADASLPLGAKPRRDAPLTPDAELVPVLKRCKRKVTVAKCCGHTFSESCPELLQIVADGGVVKKGANCAERVVRELPACGHEVTVACKVWQQFQAGTAAIPCKEQVERPCWNAKACGSVALRVPCSMPAGSAICCERTTVWTCGKNAQHLHSLQLCLRGEPSSCPDCDEEALDAAIASAGAEDSGREPLSMVETTAVGGVFGWLFGAPGSAQECVLERCLAELPAPVQRLLRDAGPDDAASVRRKFREAQASCLRSFKMWRSRATVVVFERQQFEPAVLPVLFVLAGDPKVRAQQEHGFGSAKAFVRGDTLNGIVLYRLTAENLRALAGQTKGSAEKTLLFGFVYAVNWKSGEAWPGNKGSKQLVKRWRETEVCDFVEFAPDKSTQMRKLVLWEPFPVIATHRAGPLDAARLEDLATRLAHVAPNEAMRKGPVKFRNAGGGAANLVRGVPVAGGSAAEAPSGSAAAAALAPGDVDGTVAPAMQTMPSLEASPWAAALRFPTVGPGEEAPLQLSWFAERFGGATEGIAASTEKDLMRKLSFVDEEAPPFAGKKVLEQLLGDMCTGGNTKSEREGTAEAAGAEAPRVLQLLLALEIFHKGDTERALGELEAYCCGVKGSEAQVAHPLLLLALARIGAPDLARGSPPLDADLLLCNFALGFPAMAGALLSGDERARVQRLSDGEQDGGAAVAHEAAGAPAPTPAEAWADLKETSRCKSEAMEKLLKLTGLRKVKAFAVQLFKKGQAFARMDPHTRDLNAPMLNYVLLGNPGTGKTTAARLLAEILHDSGLRKRKDCVECGGRELKDGGADEFKKKAESAKGGVLFIDEAYAIDPVGDRFNGAGVANEMLTVSENQRKELSIILAGYEDELTDKLFNFNPGFRSRFTEVVFEDFAEDELLEVWTGMRSEARWREEDSRLGRVVVRRLAKLRGRKGFGNARDVRKCFEQAVGRAMSRPEFDADDMVLAMEDAVGENPSLNPKLEAAVQKIEQMTGWVQVKQSIRELVKLCAENYDRELAGQRPLPVFLNRMFLGNPGTGKTTCAKLYGEVLKHLGFLSNGEVLEKTAGDLGGQVVGEAQQKTAALIEAARGKVLLIDEAYVLDDEQYGKKALDVLVEKVQGTEADDIAVLLLGYEPEMMRMLERQNPGLRRRFAPEQAFRFEDYSENQLLKILTAKCKQESYLPSLEFQERALKQLEMQRRSESHFGNAGSVNNLLKKALAKASAARKCNADGMMRLEAEDIVLPTDLVGEDPFAALDKLYRMEAVRQKLQQLKSQVDLAEGEGDARPPLGHFVFVGAPGTGKTTVARIMAGMLCRSGVLAKADVVETSGLSLTGEFVGSTKKKVEEQLAAAKGGVLFIDEAYELGKGVYGSEACSALVAAMTDERYAGLVIVIAGYQADMHKMLDTNPGLKSRFQHFLEFPDWAPQDCVELFEQKAAAASIGFDDAGVAREVLARAFQKLLPLKGWGNARDVQKMWEGAQQQRASRLADERSRGAGGAVEQKQRAAGGAKLFSEEDLRLAMEALVGARGGAVGSQRGAGAEDAFAALDKLYRMEGVKQKLQRLKNAAELARREGEEPEPVGHFVFSGAPGTGKTTVAREMAAILFRLELIARNRVWETTGLELTGEFIGSTKKKVEEKLDQARGSVLFIDEAYTLGQGQYGAEACDTLVAAMTSPEYATTTIIIAGYQADVAKMLDTNPGLKSRFKHFYEFPDWTETDCMDHFEKQLTRGGFEFDPDVLRSVALPGFRRLIPLKGWGNARDVHRFWESVKQHRADRVIAAESASDAPAAGKKDIVLSDVKSAMDALVAARLGSRPAEGGVSESDPFAPLDKLYRMEQVREKLQQLRNAYVVAQRDGDDQPPLGHFVFVGSPGTGKTTVARVMRDILYDLGLLGRRHVEEVSALDMQAGYIGQTALKVAGLLDKAKGGILFIDEAYNLGRGHFAAEALDTLVAAMTNPQYAGLVVVLAGYPLEIDNMLNQNAGLKSRFAHTLQFPDWRPEDCVQCFLERAERERRAVHGDVAQELREGFERLAQRENFGNARDVGAAWEAAKRFRADRLVRGGESEDPSFLAADVRSGMEELVRGRSVGHGAKTMRAQQPGGFEATPPPPQQGPSQGGAAGREAGREAEAPRHEAEREAAAEAPRREVAREAAAEATRDAAGEADAVAEVIPPKNAGEELQAAAAELEVTNHFADIPKDVIQAVNDSLLEGGVNLADGDAVLSFHPGDLARKVGARTPYDEARRSYYLERWRAALRAALEQQRQIQVQLRLAEEQRQRDIAEQRERERRAVRIPLWRCAVCGRRGCQVAPYIDGYEERLM